MSYINYENIENPTKRYDCDLTLLKSDLDASLYDPLIEVIGKLNLIGNYIKNNEDSWSSEGLSEGGDTLEFPLSAINGLQTSSTNKILYYNNDGDWEYKDYKELKFPLSELYDLTSNNLDLDGTKWVLVYDLETLNDRGWKFLPYNTGTGSGLTLGKVAYDLNTVNNPNTNVKQILVWDNDGNGTWKWQVENYSSSSSGGLTWDDLINQGSEKIHPSHLPSSWWGRTISNNIVEGNLSGNIQYIKFDSGGHTVYLGLDSDGNLRVSKSENGNDGSSGANFYATGGVSALGNSSSSGGGGTTPGETSLKSLLNNVNNLGTNYANPSTGYTIVYDNGSWVDRKLDLSELGNVSINGVSNNDVLTYNGTNWVNSPALSVVSSLGLLSDVDDTVSDIKALNVIQPSGSILSYSYPLTLLVGSTSETSSNIYNSEVEWKLYVFLLETDSTAAHLISGGSLTSNMGIVTRLNFGLAGSPMNNYRFPTYITGVRLQSSDMTRYHITGAKHIKGKTINNNSQTWNLDYDETFCSDKVYIINDELYSNAFKVLTTDNLNATGLSGTNYAISIDNGKLYVNVPWTDTKYSSGNGIDVSDTLSNGKYPISAVAADGGGLAVDVTGIKIDPTTNKRVLWGNQDKLVNDIGTVDQVASLRYIERAYLRNDLYLGGLDYNVPNTINTAIRMAGRDESNNDFRFYNVLNLTGLEGNSNRVSFDVGWGPATQAGERPQPGGQSSTHITDAYKSKLRLWGYDIELKSKGNDTVVMTLTKEGSTYFPLATTGPKEGNTYTGAGPAAGLRIGDAVLYWDEANLALALAKYNTSTPSSPTAANFYATGGVSALGMSSGSGSVPAMTFGNLTVTSGAAINALNTSSGSFIANSSGAKLGANKTFELNDGSVIQFNYDNSGTTLPIKLSARADGLYVSIGTNSAKKILTAS